MSNITCDAVTVRLDETEVLTDVSLALNVKTLAVVGDNGSGKSTFARLIGGLVQPTEGAVTVLGNDTRHHRSQLRRQVAMIFSNPDAQIIMPTVKEDIAFSLRGLGLSRGERDARVAAVMDRFGLRALTDHSGHSLSGGQKQLLALAGAFVREPDLLIADEPTAYLDARNARTVADHLFTETHRLVLVTHDLALARRCESAVLLADGRLAQVGDSPAVVGRYEMSLA